jgi:class 3 adenylate cyclase
MAEGPTCRAERIGFPSPQPSPRPTDYATAHNLCRGEGARAGCACQILSLTHLPRHPDDSALTGDPAAAFEPAYLKGTGDGAILAFASPADADRFAAAFHGRADQHNQKARQATEHRCFRIGIYTGEIVRGKPHDPTDSAFAAGAHLRELLAGKKVLLVVDDIWSSVDVEPFRGLGAGSALLITTRNRRILPAYRLRHGP